MTCCKRWAQGKFSRPFCFCHFLKLLQLKIFKMSRCHIWEVECLEPYYNTYWILSKSLHLKLYLKSDFQFSINSDLIILCAKTLPKLCYMTFFLTEVSHILNFVLPADCVNIVWGTIFWHSIGGAKSILNLLHMPPEITQIPPAPSFKTCTTCLLVFTFKIRNLFAEWNVYFFNFLFYFIFWNVYFLVNWLFF